jgi:hypothetical protein
VPNTIRLTCTLPLNLSQDPRIHLSESDFWDFTENGNLCNAAGEIGQKEFETIIRRKIHTFVQTRLTDFSDCRTAADMELTSIGALKTIVSEVLLMANEQRRCHSEILSAIAQLQGNCPASIHDSRIAQTADFLVHSNSHSGSYDSGSAPGQPEEIGQPSQSVSKHSTNVVPESLELKSTAFFEQNKDSENIPLSCAVDISVSPLEVPMPSCQAGACIPPQFQEKGDLGDNSSVAIDQHGLDTETSVHVLGFFREEADTINEPVPLPFPPNVQISNTETTQVRLPVSSRVDCLSSTSHLSGQRQGKINIYLLHNVIRTSNILMAEVEVPQDVKEFYGQEISASESSITNVSIVKDSSSNFNSCAVIDKCQFFHTVHHASIMDQKAIDILPSLNLGLPPEHPPSSPLPVDFAQIYPLLT